MTADETRILAAGRFPLADSMADLVMEIGLDGRIVFASPSSVDVAGYTVPELLGRRAIDLVHPADRRRVLRHYLRVWRRAPLAPFGFRARHRDGRSIWLEGNPAPIAGGTGGWADVFRNIETSRAREERLLAARQSAEAESNARAEFLANMSHEIRTPVTSIIGFMQVLRRDGSLGETQLGHVERVEEAGRNLLRMVNDVLDLSKIESGTIRLNERAFAPAVLVRDAAALIRPQAAEKGLSLSVSIVPDDIATVLGDADRLRQVLLNLLSNAVKFTARGGVTLRFTATPAGSATDLTFVIEDSGMGIAPEQLPALFHRFTQADRSIARRFGGTGLGLAISKRLVEAMEGSIEVESTIEVGSRFTVRIRLRSAQPSVAPDPDAGVTRIFAPARADTLRDCRLLVAEDVRMNQKLVEALLAPLGCAIDMVQDGAEALNAVQQHDYALVLMDMQMPSLDGMAASRAIRALGGRFAELPIIALTANVFPEEIERARAAGMNDVITKPIDSAKLIATVVRWANRRESAKAGGR